MCLDCSLTSLLLLSLTTWTLALTKTWDNKTAEAINNHYSGLLNARGVHPACAFTPIDVCLNGEVEVEEHCSYVITSPANLLDLPHHTRLNCHVELVSQTASSLWMELRTLSLAPPAACGPSSRSRLSIGREPSLKKRVCGHMNINELVLEKKDFLIVYNVSNINDFTMTFSIHVFPI